MGIYKLFLMSNNPFSKFVVDPSKVPDPNTITARQFENYASTELRRVQSSLRVYRRSAIYLAGCFGLMLFAGYMTGGAARKNVFGTDSKFLLIFSRPRRRLFGS